MSNANLVEIPKSGDRTAGCLGCFVIVWLAGTSLAASLPVEGFWLSVGMFATVFIGGIIGIAVGGTVGTSVRNFASPRLAIVDGGIGNILNVKMFWLFIPQLTGMVLGWALAVHLLLMLFWGMPLSALGGRIIAADTDLPSPGERLRTAAEAMAFVKKMSEADEKTKIDYTLMAGIDAGSVVMVEEMIRRGADLNTPRLLLNKDGLPYPENIVMAPLFAALTDPLGFNTEEIVRLLLDNGADVNIRDDSLSGPTPLLCALRNNMPSLVIPMVVRGAKLDVADVDGKTPLHHAMNMGDEKAILLMLTMGAPTSVKDKWGHTPLDYADEKTARMVRALMQVKEKER